MKKAETAHSRLEKIIDSAILNNPHSRNIIEAFKPVLLERSRLAAGLDFRKDVSLKIDEAGFKEGRALGDQNNLFFPDDPWKLVALGLIPALAKGFPAMTAELEKLKGLIESGNIEFNGQSGDHIQDWASSHSIDEGILGFLAHLSGRVILERRAQDWGKLLEGFEWNKGYCPICGSSPMLAKVADGIATRWLHCSECGHEWIFSRVICPFCGNSNQKEMNYYSVEDKDQESTFACEQCKRYLITVSRVSDMIPFDAEVSALSLVHLDVVMQEKGYLPMASCEWNRLSE
jgi:FdhE protein